MGKEGKEKGQEPSNWIEIILEIEQRNTNRHMYKKGYNPTLRSNHVHCSNRAHGS